VDGQPEAAVAGPRLLFEQHGLVGESAASAAVLRRHGEAEQAEFAGPAIVVAVGVALGQHARGVRQDLLGEEGTDQVGELVVLGLAPRGGSRRRHPPTMASYWRTVNSVPGVDRAGDG
jgi:hypothetical protein